MESPELTRLDGPLGPRVPVRPPEAPPSENDGKKSPRKEKAKAASHSGTKVHKAWYRRWWAIVLYAFAFFIVAFAIALQPIARWATHKLLNNLKGYQANFSDVHVSIIPLQMEIRRFNLKKDGRPKAEEPLLYGKRIMAGLSGRKLLKGHLVATLAFENAKIALTQEPNEPVDKPAKENIAIADQLTKLMPLELDEVSIKNLEVLYLLRGEKSKRGAETANKPEPKIWLHGIDATIENIATRANLSEGTTTLAMSGSLQKTGQMSVFATADPLQKGLTFEGRAQLKGLEFNDLYAILAQETDLKIPRGSVDVFVEFKARNGHLSGGVKPILKDVKVESDSPKLITKLTAAVANLGLKIFSDRVPGRNAVATVIPIHGDLTDPKLELLPTLLGVIRNAFVEGISASFRNVPPPKADKKENILEQAAHALSKDKGGVPKSQPTDGSSGASAEKK